MADLSIAVDHKVPDTIHSEHLAAIVEAKLAGPSERAATRHSDVLEAASPQACGKPQSTPHAPVEASGTDALSRAPKPPCAACGPSGNMPDLASELSMRASLDSRRSLSSRSPMLRVRAINHISRIVRDVRATANFYKRILGFREVVRPSTFNFSGAWLHGCGVGLHLIQGEPVAREAEVIPKSDHLSFQVDMPLASVEEVLTSLDMRYVKQIVREGPYLVTQLFFHDPDRNMIEICDCDQLPVEYIASAGWDVGSLEEEVLATRVFGPSGSEMSAATVRALA
ncbi:unnamed protein product [Pedinophyceae sp. YPF-701]|nr:unnamed protein product [Pedinophyceae sp. YPF-701]